MRRYQTVYQRVGAGAPVAERCPGRKHRLNPTLRLGLAAWLLTMTGKYHELLAKRSTRKDARNVPGYLETRKYAKNAIAVITELVNRLSESFPSDDYVFWAGEMAKQWGLDGECQIEEPIRWEQPSVPGTED